MEDEQGLLLNPQLTSLGCDVVFLQSDMSKSTIRHRLFAESPYETSLIFDSDLIFLSPIDELWTGVEADGLLVTRFFAPPYGVEGSPQKRGWADRVNHLESIREFVDQDIFDAALHRMLVHRIDVNIGVMGISRPLGDSFLKEWNAAMEQARDRQIAIIDEMLTVALIAGHRHFLADEHWNCPADEFFRRTNLADARVIHFFADGCRLDNGIRLGRNPDTWAGKKWFSMYQLAAEELDLEQWKALDSTYDYDT